VPASLPPAQSKCPPRSYRRIVPSQKPKTGKITPTANAINKESASDGITAPNEKAAKPFKGFHQGLAAAEVFKYRSRIETKIGRQTAVAQSSNNWRPIRTPQFKYRSCFEPPRYVQNRK
jgi:hypothetical protein